jgi:DNA-binding MarR family transcriptional regulator
MTSAKVKRADMARAAWQIMADLVLDNQRRREVADEVGLSFGKTRALRRIAAKPMSMRELAALLGMDPPNLTPVVDDLERAGLVERQAHPTDRRAKVVVATPAGAELAQRAQAILDRPASGLSGLTTDDLETLVRILSEIQWDPEANG